MDIHRQILSQPADRQTDRQTHQIASPSPLSERFGQQMNEETEWRRKIAVDKMWPPTWQRERDNSANNGMFACVQRDTRWHQKKRLHVLHRVHSAAGRKREQKRKRKIWREQLVNENERTTNHRQRQLAGNSVVWWWAIKISGLENRGPNSRAGKRERTGPGVFSSPHFPVVRVRLGRICSVAGEFREGRVKVSRYRLVFFSLRRQLI